MHIYKPLPTWHDDIGGPYHFRIFKKRFRIQRTVLPLGGAENLGQNGPCILTPITPESLELTPKF